MFQRVSRQWPVFLADSEDPRLYLRLRTVTASPGGAGKSLWPQLLAFPPRYSSPMESIYNICQVDFLKCPTAGNPEEGGREHRRSSLQENNFEQTMMKMGNTKPCLCPNWDLLARPARRGASSTRKPCSQAAYVHAGTAARTSHARRVGRTSLPRDTLITRSKRYQ